MRTSDEPRDFRRGAAEPVSRLASGEVPDDSTLVRSGMDPALGGRALIVACGALAREILQVAKMNGWTHLDLACLPAIWHNHPERIAEGIRATVARHRDSYDRIFVAYADCGTGGELRAACDELGIEMIAGPHCYSFFEGNDSFADRAGRDETEMSAFYLTDFLARQFDAFVWRPLGLDRHPELLESYFGNYTKLVYLAQTDDPALTERARGCADLLGLEFERRYTGYGDLEGALRDWATR